MTWGGARANAGRPARGPIASEPHKARPHLHARHPVHVRARLAQNLRSRLRRGRAYRALRRAIALSLARDDFRIVHIAVLPTRLELVVEATDRNALARGMQGFQVSAARCLNRAARRRGNVFPDRYAMEILATRAKVRAIAGAVPQMNQVVSGETWLVRIELARYLRPRRWIRTRADEDS